MRSRRPPIRADSRAWRVGGFLLLALLSLTRFGEAGNKPRKKVTRPPEYPADAESSPASAAARLETADCLAELERHAVRFDKAEPAPGVKIPVRLDGPVSGITYRTDFPDRERSKVPFEVFDCRLVVALVGFGRILAEHDVREVRIFSAFRPPLRGTPPGKIADRHPGALAVDFRLFRRANGEVLEVLKDFPAQIGRDPCGPAAPTPSPESPEGRELRAMLCAAAKARLFHVLLSPNHDRAHRDHFHAEVRPGARWFIVR